jgi:hypothetical protein
VELDELVERVKAGPWPQRVAAVRSVPAEFPGKEHQAVYAELARSFYEGYLAPHFHLVPWPDAYRDRAGFLAGYDAAAQHTSGFTAATPANIEAAIVADSRSLRIFRLIIGYSPKELSEAVTVFGAARLGESAIRGLESGTGKVARVKAALPALAQLIYDIVAGTGGYTVSQDLRDRGFLGKTDKPDTEGGWASVATFASQGVPYHELLYQRFYGGAFRQLQDAGGTLKGDILEDGVEQLFTDNRVPYIRTVPGTQATAGRKFGVTVQPAPDFILHDNANARGLLECKSAGDGGTARDKAGRFSVLRREASRLGGIPVLAVLEGFGWRRLNDALGPVVRDCDGRVFMPADLSELLDVDPVRDLVGLAPTP